jgi:hypothetical protein
VNCPSTLAPPDTGLADWYLICWHWHAWHRVRVYYDREAERRRRLAYHVNVSILVASAVLLIAVILGIYPFVQFWFQLPAHSGGTDIAFHAPQDSPDWPTTTQELCAIVAVLCIIYLSIAFNFRAK